MSSSIAQSNQTPQWQHGSLPVVHTAVEIDDVFWAPRLQTVRERTLFYMYEVFEQRDYFEYKQWTVEQGRIPFVFWESDLSKWIEAASYSLASHPDPKLEALVDRVIAFFASVQQPDGYLNLWFTAVEPEMRWRNLRDLHELYCAGHLIEGAVAHFQATGKRSLLDIVCRYVDYIDSIFGPDEGKRRGYCGHEEIELALVKLSRATGEKRYLKLSQYFVEERGARPHYFDQEARERGEEPSDFWATTYEYNQSHLPIREQHEVVGHAVRAMYLYSALADLAKELNDPSLYQLCVRFWEHLGSRRMYVIGSLGSSADNEGLTTDYDLPNDSAYAETCAAIGLIFWAHRMLQLDADSRYADVLERTLYNGVLSGISLDGESFFYVNPLASAGLHHRQPWYRCACCPPNIVRLMTSLGQYIYGVGESEILVHLYIQSRSTISLGGRSVSLRQETTYPWDGTIQFHVEVEEPAEFSISLRIPGWCKSAGLAVNGEEVQLAEHVHKGYARIQRRWQSGDTITLELAMPIERVYAHPSVEADSGSVALQKGPLVYCLETADNSVPLHLLHLPRSAALSHEFEAELLGGVAVIHGQAKVVKSGDWGDALYRTTPPLEEPHALVAIPYYAWDQRQAGEMRVWIREDER